MNKIHPVTSLLCAFIYSLLVSFSLFDVLYLLPILFILYKEKVYLLKILKKLFLLNVFIFVLFLFLLIESTFEDAINVYLRANSIILFNISLFFHSKGYDIVRALSILKFPHSFVSSLYFTLKMIEFLTKDFKNITYTLKARGFKAKNSFFTYEVFGNILGLLFVKSIRKSEALKQTFIIRGFRGNLYLNSEFNLRYADYILCAILFGVILLKVLL